MRPILLLCGLLLSLSSGVAGAAPKDELHDAFVKFLQAKSFRATITDLGKGQQVSSMEFVAPDRYRMNMPGGPSQLIIGDAMYMDMDGQVMRMTHTFVHPSLEGRGIAAALVGAAFEHAREKGLKVQPLCSYVYAYMQRHPETRDLRA